MARPMIDEEPRNQRITISLTESEDRTIRDYANKHFKGNISQAVLDYPLSLYGFRRGANLDYVTNGLDILLSTIQRKLESGIAPEEIKCIGQLMAFKNRFESFYSSLQTTYDSLKNVPHIKFEDIK